MKVWQQIGDQLRSSSVEVVFGLMGDGNLRFIPHLTDSSGLRYVAARHEGGAVAMADAFSRVTGAVGVCTVTQGPGLTNALTALAETVRAHSAVVLLVGEPPGDQPEHNQRLDHGAVLGSIGLEHRRVGHGGDVAAELAGSISHAVSEQHPVCLTIPIDVQEQVVPARAGLPARPGLRVAPDPLAVRAVADAVESAQRPLILAGRGAVESGSREALLALAEQIGAVVATTAMANGLFAGSPRSLGLCGGFASERAAAIAEQTDLVLAFGSSLHPWATRRGRMFPSARIIRVDVREVALGSRLSGHETVIGDASLTADALANELAGRGIGPPPRFKLPGGERRPAGFVDQSLPDRIDPRSLMLMLDTVLPDERTIVIDSGYYVIFPTTLLAVPDARGFVFSQAFQSLGLGIGGAVGAAVARPDRLPVLIIGDGGLLMTLGELETIARYELPVLVIVMNDGAYGAEVHTMEELGLPTAHAFFGDVDFAAIAAALGFGACTIRARDDCDRLRKWMRAPRGPYLADCKINGRVLGDWVE